MIKLSIVVPCYNEAKNIPLLLQKCVDITKLGEIEVILVDNGSTDESQDVLLKILKDNDFGQRLDSHRSF